METMPPALSVYKVVDGIPIYLYPTPKQIQELKNEYVKKYGTLKEARVAMRKFFKCFLSENSIWKARVRTFTVTKYVDPPEDPKVSIVVVMGRAKQSLKDVDIISVLRNMGVKANPYRTPSANDPNPCFGFYVKSYEKLEKITSVLAKHNMVEALMIVNAVWYVDYKSPISFRPLMNLFIPSVSPSFKVLNGYINSKKVTLFPSGKARIVKALTPEEAQRTAGELYALLLDRGALKSVAQSSSGG